MGEKTNLTKLTHNLLAKLNDPKEIIRKELENLVIELSFVIFY